MKRAVVFLICCALAFSFVTDSAAQSRTIFHSDDCDEKMIALTFDDGPHPRYTEQILGILDKYGVKATFFFVGQNVEYYPDTALKVVKAGHEIGNHTYDHNRVEKMSQDDVLYEMTRCDDMIYSLDEYQTVLFRPPEGAFGKAVENSASALGYSVILWSIDTRDWAHSSPQEIYENVTKNIDGGDIILMHDYVSYNSPTPQALELIIPELQRQGYKFVTVSELIN